MAVGKEPTVSKATLEVALDQKLDEACREAEAIDVALKDETN